MYYHYFSGGLSNFLYYVSLPDDIDSCNNLKNIKRARKDTSLQEPKEVRMCEGSNKVQHSQFREFENQFASRTESV